ncbi:MAG: hypothetical protein ACXAAQ_16845 [Candidatus Thorarchaeota archaeon]
MTDERTNYVYEFTYSSAPGLREIFQCKYVKPDEALNRFRKILALTESPFDFKIVVSDETMGEESSFQVKGGSIEEMFVKFKVFMETSTGYVFANSRSSWKQALVMYLSRLVKRQKSGWMIHGLSP